MKHSSLFLLLLLLFTACHKPTTHYVIGVSQCSEDEWRQQMNKEMLREMLFYENTDIEIRTARDNSNKQIEDIRYFIDKKVDLLVIAPNEAAIITPIVEKAFRQGIPVIIVDRKILSDQYTAYIGADNYAIGKAAGYYIGNRLGGKGNVVELTGLSGSTPAIERHKGFAESLSEYPQIKLLDSKDAEWLQSPAEETMEHLLKVFPQIDVVFAQNDRMAVGAYLAARKQKREKDIRFIGIDALPDTDAGVDQVLNGVFDATFIYPTGGDKVIQTAMAILKKEPFKKETILSTAVVDKSNAQVMKLQNLHINELDNKIETLDRQIDSYLSRYSTQQLLLYSILAITILTVTLCGILIKAYWTKDRLNKELAKRNNKITRQKEQLEQQRDQLIALSRQLEEATQSKLVFFTNVSHDFRTPLTLIAGPIEQLLSEGSLTSTETELLEIAHKNTRILLRLVNQILDFRKYENGKMELTCSEFDLQQAIEEWNTSFRTAALQKHIKFSYEAETKTRNYLVKLDLEKMESIYFNLISNALKFTPENGHIHSRLDYFLKEDVPYVQLTISDDGIGISTEHAQNIFDRFYKTDVHHTGSGIGLALVKAFVELQGGTIRVKSKEKKGTTFILEIPAYPSPNQTTTETEQTAAELLQPKTEENKAEPFLLKEASPAKGSDEGNKADTSTGLNPDKETILVIDDNQDICHYITQLLSEHYTLIEAHNGKEGLNMAMKYVPDLIISDIMMPEMDGIECCRHLKTELQTSHIPVILLTACSLDEQRISGFENGADSYISKPFNSQLLITRIRNLLDNRNRLKQFFGDATTLSKESVSHTDKDFITKFRRQIELNLSNSDLSVEDLGEQMGLSRVQLYRKIKALTNYSPNELLRIARLKKAASLLSSTEKTIAEITYEVGFTSPSYFTKCYKEYFGENPTELIKRKK